MAKAEIGLLPSGSKARAKARRRETARIGVFVFEICQ
jgi:hypothetical protein